MDITKKAVVEPPKRTVPPVKAQPQPDHKAHHEAETGSGEAARRSLLVSAIGGRGFPAAHSSRETELPNQLT